MGPAVLAEACKPKKAHREQGEKDCEGEERTPMLKCEKCKQCACQCEWPILQEAAELKSKNGLWVSKGAQGAKKKAA